jgi:hypothetical protein
MDQQTDDLIVALAADAAPVAPLPSIEARLGRWMPVAVGSAAILALVFGVRRDLSAAFSRPAFVFPEVLAGLTAMAALVAALQLSVPDARNRWRGIGAAAFVPVWVGLLLLTSAAVGVPPAAVAREPWHVACLVRVLAMSIVPTGLLIKFVLAGYPLSPGRAITLAALAGGAFAAGAVAFVCPIDRPVHLLVSHVAPGLALAAGGALALLPAALVRRAIAGADRSR